MTTQLGKLPVELEGLPVSEFNEKNHAQTGFHYEAELPETAIRDAARRFRSAGFFLETITCVDWSECFELAYVFNKAGASARAAVKVVVPKTQKETASIHDIYEAADWLEREVFDMFGLGFRNRPKMKRLLLPESSTIHPLLKSFKGEKDGTDVAHVKQLIEEYNKEFEITYPTAAEKQSDEYKINLGPQHPSTHGVLRVVLRLRGERVLAAEPVIGYVHRNQEKMGEVQEYKAFWPNMGRLDYVGAMPYNFCYSGLIERAMSVTPPPRVQAIRVLLTELNRISSHLLWLGTYLLDLGAFTPFFYCFDDRERILDIVENVTGERLTYDYFRFGGLDKDMPDDVVLPQIKKFIPHFRGRLKDYEKLLTKNVIFRNRTSGVGVISRETALAYGITGPCLRGSGVRSDIRRDEPFSIYPELDFEVPVEKDGDAFARYMVRMREMAESLKIVEQLVGRIPKGEWKVEKLPRFVPKGEYYFAVESARGLFGMHLFSDGSMQAYRMRLRTPSFANLSSLPRVAEGSFIADVVSILGSLDFVVPEIDR